MSSLPQLLEKAETAAYQAISEVSKTEFYVEIGAILLVYSIAYLLAVRVRMIAPILKEAPQHPDQHPLKALAFRCGKLLFPLFAVTLLRLSLEYSQSIGIDGWVIRVAMTLAILLLFNSFINLVVLKRILAEFLRWIGLPLLLLHLIGVLDDIIIVLESIAVVIGNIQISAYGVARVIIFGSLLFWLGRISNATGQTIIRRQQSLDMKTREVLAKLFEIGLFFLIFLLLLQVMGINLTALAVFGGAVGVGLGFGLQAIASNFISGIIILLDRSLTVGDYVELEDGRSGTVTELNMRSTTLETYDGRDIVVPNEKFITSSFTNWTHKNKKQRYRVDFSVAYDTDVRAMVEIIKDAVGKHPDVIGGEDVPFEERPDCEIDSFGDSGINMFVEFWMEGIDDGRNRVGGDLLLTILETLRENDIQIPFPQREVRILKDENNEQL